MTEILCPACNGTGGGGYPMQCMWCDGSGDVDVRDDLGRHITREQAIEQETEAYMEVRRRWANTVASSA